MDKANKFISKFDFSNIKEQIEAKDAKKNKENEKKIAAAQQALINFCKENGTAPSLYKSEKKVQKTYELQFDETFIKKSSDLFKE